MIVGRHTHNIYHLSSVDYRVEIYKNYALLHRIHSIVNYIIYMSLNKTNKRGGKSMAKLPNNIKLSPHAKQRLLERKTIDAKYNIQNIMRSSIKWYGKDDLIPNCALYKHCCYVTRKSNQMGYITDGDIEVIYSKNSHVAITVLEVKDNFKPITQHIKPQILIK